MCAHRLFVTHSSIVTSAHHTVAPKSTNIPPPGVEKNDNPPPRSSVCDLQKREPTLTPLDLLG
ncbi:expressed unknown protein [Ectocarpus siliculosus]|uniref:Uncharacterized protein n=1 Tax=Ectocarpus siliculosus TaxID=2880 RepID=D7FW19_ECTSI|nr:expressed unknown protein [Ectocarpus siliculosus]|eukprot:CBJ25539.1 expressed unknown protein [Ectocarpus siliculosus]